MAHIKKGFVCYFLIYVVTLCPLHAGAGREAKDEGEELSKDYEDVIKYEEEIAKKGLKDERTKGDREHYEGDASSNSMFEEGLDNNYQITTRKSDYLDQKLSPIKNIDDPLQNVQFPVNEGHLEDSSLTVFDKRRHFEVSDMTSNEKETDLEETQYSQSTESLMQKLIKYKIDGSKPSNPKRNLEKTNLDTIKVAFKRKDFSSDRASLREIAQRNASASTNAFSRKDTSLDSLKPVGRRPISSLRELASRRQQDKINKNIQNDHDAYLPNLEETATVNKGEFVNSYDSGQHDQSHINYSDKIRQLNRKLSDPFYAKTLNSMGVASASEVLGISCDFEKPCAWHWNMTADGGGFEITSPADILNQNSSKNFLLRGPDTDADFSENGHFLYLAVGPTTEVMTIASPEYYGIMEKCRVEVWLHQHNMQNASFKVVTEPSDGTPPWVLSEIQGNDYERWTKHYFPVGRVQRGFQIVLEVVPGALGVTRSGHIAVDNLKMAGCFAELATVDQCSARQLKCLANKVPACINSSRVCDILEDCDQGEDERQDCDKMPTGSRCSFEDGWCGWSNTRPPREGLLKWQRHSGPTPTPNTGPETDHTCQGRIAPQPSFSTANQAAVPVNGSVGVACIGRYLYVNMNGTGGNKDGPGFAANANLDSVIFNPPPKVHGDQNSKYYNSCMIRFYYHQYGKNSGSIALLLIELKDKENSTELIWRSSKNQGIDWIRAVVILPNVTTRYYLQLEARRGMRVYSDVAVDDFSMSPECFGINIPPKVLGDYNYWDPVHSGANAKPHRDFENKTYYELNSCGSTGRFGPSQEQCDVAYNKSMTEVRVMSAEKFKGVQAWTVPTEGYYTVIVHGAGGGLGSGGMGSSRGASARALLDLHKGQMLYLLIGQPGSSACIKTLSVLTESNCKYLNNSTGGMDGYGDGLPYYHSKTHEIKNTVIQDGGGGGGGATFLFVLDKDLSAFPLAVGGGGGGLGAGRASSGGSQHGQGSPPHHKRPHTGHMYGPPTSTPGAGGGWSAGSGLVTAGHEEVRGAAATDGGAGGRACSGGGGPGAGGFGGGGGGCARGGAGGGWAGGDTSQNMTNGEGGYSFVDHKWAVPGFTEIAPGGHSGSGQVIIIPAIEGCGCDYRCIALDEYRSKTQCICPQGWIATGTNQTMCELPDEWGIPYLYVVVFFGIISLLLVAALTAIFLMLYNRYQLRKQAALRHKALLEQDLRLSRLRSTADESALTSFNPNYGCDAVLAGGVDVRQLPQVARESLRLVKALGQGAFGEVYQGLYRHRDGDAIEMPVAVKTLPEMSTGQSETDFLMEAAIMAKFNHPNIVHLIGVCFDRHPRFIVLELLAGGDLKNFLRENRPKPERSSSLGMKDLVLCALDVAKGCRYMETKRFIHRDIAARNCLLTSKGPGRVVKIADFGMARDIYRSDYYRKGGKAMLPIKWMPPEAFLDGIFTSKTDVWSFGVLLWEVFSLGIMPYTGCANREVMQMVTGGGRLDIPQGCPMEIYRMMCDCWNPSPQDRPTFSQLFERLTHCTQDPDLMIAPLPCFNRPESIGRDEQSQSLQHSSGLNRTSDYLVPLLPMMPSDLQQPQGSMDPTQQLPNNGEAVASTAVNELSSSQVNNDTCNLGSPPTNHKAAFKQLYPPEYGNIALACRNNPNMDTSANAYHSEATSQTDHAIRLNNANHTKQPHDQNYSVKYQAVDGNFSAKINDGNYGNKFQNDSYGKNNQSDSPYPSKNPDSGYGSKSSDSTVSSMGSKLENLMGHTSKFQPSKSTDRLLASMEAAAGSLDDDDNLNDAETRGEEWETSFTEPPKMAAVGKSASCNSDGGSGPAVEKLISIDTPQQTPTSLQPPDTTLSSKNNYQNRTANHIPPKQDIVPPSLPKVQNTEARNSSPPYKKVILPSNANAIYVKHRPLCLDAAQLEQNLNALKKNSGSVNLNNMNILPPYVNVLTPNKLSKKSESRKIQIDPKKAIIHDLANSPGAEGNGKDDSTKEVTTQEPRLKTSASSHSLINGPLTDLPYADSDNISSSSSSGGTNVISKMAPGSKQNNYTEVAIKEDVKKLPRKQNSTGGFLNNDSEISC